MSPRPSLDLHAHLDVAIDPTELPGLGVVFAATRSLDEAEQALRRSDAQTVWGVGCHPGVPAAQAEFDLARFKVLLRRTAFVSEVGLDGKSKVPLAQQKQTLAGVLSCLQAEPRITSIHSASATEQTLRSLEARPIRGAILHWWLGSPAETRRAIELGCYFSVNASSVRRTEVLAEIPKDRLLTETDHPFGDRREGRGARPGGVGKAEAALAAQHGLTVDGVRSLVWGNLANLVGDADCAELLPRLVRRQLIAS